MRRRQGLRPRQSINSPYELMNARRVEELGKSKDVFSYSGVVNKLSVEERRYVNGASLGELETLMNVYVQKAIEAQTRWATNTRKRARSERAVTTLLTNFHQYAQAYSGVVELMNGAGPGYGNAAYGALSLLLVVS